MRQANMNDPVLWGHYERLTTTIEKGLSNFIEVGKAMIELRDGKYYKAGGYSTFEECMEDLFGVKRMQSWSIIRASELAERMSAIADISIPNEGTARELLTIKDDDIQIQVAKRAHELARSADAVVINSAFVKAAKAEIIGVKPKPEKVKAEVVSTPAVSSGIADEQMQLIRQIAGREDVLKSVAERLAIDVQSANPEQLLVVLFEAYVDRHMSRPAEQVETQSAQLTSIVKPKSKAKKAGVKNA